MTRAPMPLLCVLTAAVAVSCAQQEAPAAAPPEVYVAEVVQQDVPVYVEIVGQTRGSQDVEIRARVEGFLDRVAFREGAFVLCLLAVDKLPLLADPVVALKRTILVSLPASFVATMVDGLH